MIDQDGPAPANPLSADKAKTLTFDLLREPNRIERLRRLSNLLAQISPENWLGLVEGFETQKTFEGRENLEEWLLVLERIGEVAGASGVEFAMLADGPNRNERVAPVFVGWSASDPDTATAWLEGQPREMKERLRFSLLEGLARSAPEKALAINEEEKFLALDQKPFQIVRGAIQQGGFAAAEQLLQVLRHRPDATESFKQQVFDAISEKKVLMSGLQGNPMSSLYWLDGYLGEKSPAGGNAIHQIVDSAARADANATLQWLEQRTHLLNTEQANAAFPPAMLAIWQKDPAQFEQWISANPNHPQYDQIAEALVLSLRHNSQLAEARQWNATIRDAALRQRTDNIIRAAEAAQAANTNKSMNHTSDH